jgi:cell division protein FtsN
MKKLVILSLGLCAAFVFTSCKSPQESAYRKAYEKAKAQETAQQAATNTVQAQTQTTQTTPTTPVATDNSSKAGYVDNVPVRSEKVSIVNGTGIKDFSVVCGSFTLQVNAESLQGRLKQAGYPAQIVLNTANNYYRVLATTFADKTEAVKSRDELRKTYPDAWLLYNK